jgi:LPS export ABC transporter protein LptC
LKKTTYLGIACALLIIAGGLYYFNKTEPLTPPPKTQEAKSEVTSNIIFAGSSIIEQKDGKKLWELTAETVEVDPKTQNARLINIKGTLYRDNGGKVDLIAQEGFVDTKTRDITLQGNVKAISSDGAVFTAPQALWVGKDQRLFGSGGITLTRDDTVITGDTVETDGDMQKIKVQGNAHIVKGGTAQ